jgi:hypothetical protein
VNENLQALCDPAASDRLGARQTERSARLEVFASYSGVALPDPAFVKKQFHFLGRGLFQAPTALFEEKVFGA